MQSSRKSAAGAKDFIFKGQNWIKAKKAIEMEKQFAEGNNGCSIYNIGVVAPAGDKANFKLVGYVKLLKGKIIMESVCFSGAIKFAKAMGFMYVLLNFFN